MNYNNPCLQRPGGPEYPGVGPRDGQDLGLWPGQARQRQRLLRHAGQSAELRFLCGKKEKGPQEL